MKHIDALKHQTTGKVLEAYIKTLDKWIQTQDKGLEDSLQDLRAYYLCRKDGTPEIMLLAEEKILSNYSHAHQIRILPMMISQSIKVFERVKVFLESN